MPAGGSRPNTGGARVGAGRKPFIPTKKQRETVRLLTFAGLPQPLIAEQIVDPGTGKPVSDRTLRTKFKAEIGDGAEAMLAMVAKGVIQKALGNGPQSVSCAIFLLKCRGGFKWRETTAIEHSGPNQGPILTGTIDPNDALEAYLKIIKAP
jgi:hypothetical protein